MTCKEKYMREHPDESISEVIKNHCPHHFSYIDKLDICPGCAVGEDCELCKLCWNREIPETLDKLEHENKKEKENMCECKEKAELIEQVKDYQSRLEEVTELWQAAKKNLAVYARRLESQVEIILRKDAVINDYRAKIDCVAQTNEDITNQLAAERAKVERLENMVRLRDEEIENLRNMAVTSILTTRNPYIERNEVITALRNSIVKLENKFKVDELPYARYADHIHMKYKSLTDAGFSHDDAMGLIPMWDDNEFEGFTRSV